MEENNELSEFIIIEGPNLNSHEVEREIKWIANNSKLFLDFYKEKREKVGSFQIKTIKAMWQHIADSLQNLLRVTVSPSQCENRWRVLERGYKKFVDNQSSTGRGKRFLEYEEEMSSILGKKKNLP